MLRCSHPTIIGRLGCQMPMMRHGHYGIRSRSHRKPIRFLSSSPRLTSFRLTSRRLWKTKGARRSSSGSSTLPTSEHSVFQTILSKVRAPPVEYATIPCVAAFVGIMTNWMGVKMLFYPIEFVGCELIARDPQSPWAWFGWQGVVPTKTQPMAERLVKIVTQRLLSLQEAFGRLEPHHLSVLLLPAVQESIRNECGEAWYRLLQPILPLLLQHLLTKLQTEVDQVLDLKQVVLSSFLRDKVVLVELFQKVGRVELEFLVNSGFGFGFLLGISQMAVWAATPQTWTLPVAGALVGYVTNWIAIKLLFEPADPVDMWGLFQIQGLFESRQIEVSDEFGGFMEQRVLNSSSLLQELSSDGPNQTHGELYDFLRRHLPYPIPEHILIAAVHAVQQVANNPNVYPEVHSYVQSKLDIQETLSSRLKLLSPTDFENLLHPVFQEDEITLIVTGGVLGAVAGLAQTRLGWGGPAATRRAMATIFSALTSSLGFYLWQKMEELEDEKDPPLSAQSRPALRRRQTVVRITPLEEEIWYQEHQ